LTSGDRNIISSSLTEKVSGNSKLEKEAPFQGCFFSFLAHNTSFLRPFQPIQKKDEEYTGVRHPKMGRVRGKERKKRIVTRKSQSLCLK
jgi:hypothetical protein